MIMVPRVNSPLPTFEVESPVRLYGTALSARLGEFERIAQVGGDRGPFTAVLRVIASCRQGSLRSEPTGCPALRGAGAPSQSYAPARRLGGGRRRERAASLADAAGLPRGCNFVALRHDRGQRRQHGRALLARLDVVVRQRRALPPSGGGGAVKGVRVRWRGGSAGDSARPACACAFVRGSCVLLCVRACVCAHALACWVGCASTLSSYRGVCGTGAQGNARRA
jgi:hypothetical protein